MINTMEAEIIVQSYILCVSGSNEYLIRLYGGSKFIHELIQ